MGGSAQGPAPAGRWRAWVLASRPATLWAAVTPVTVGMACAAAANGFRLGPALAALSGAILIQIGTNFANDLFDFEKGADTDERLGPTRAVQAGLLSTPQMRAGMALVFGLATLVGIYLTWVAGPLVVLIGLTSVTAGIAYTAGPFPLGYHGLGDVLVLLFFGFVAVCGTAFVQLGSVPELAWWAALPVGSLATAILVVNNVRDRRTDSLAGKRTLVVRWGLTAARVEYVGLLIAAYAVPFALLARGLVDVWILLPELSLPMALVLIRRLNRDEGRALNRTLAGTARLLLVFGLLFALGIVIV